MKKIISVLSSPLILLALMVGSGCASLDKNFVDNPANRQPLAPLNLTMAVEPFFLRFDLIRNTATLQGKDTNHYLVIRLGNGLIIDANKNLSVDLVEFYQLGGQASFNIVRKATSNSPADVIYEKKENVFTRRDDLPFGAKTTVMFRTDSVTIDEGFLAGQYLVDIKPDSLDFRLTSFSGKLSNAIVNIDSAGKYQIFGSLEEVTFEQTAPSAIRVNNAALAIEQADNIISFKYNGFSGHAGVHNFIKTATGFIFFDEYYRGVEVKREGNTIKYNSAGNPTVTYIING